MNNNRLLDGLPPIGYRVLDTWNLEQARDDIGRSFGTSRITVLTPDHRVRVVRHYASLGVLGVGSFACDGPVEIDGDGRLERRYLVLIPLHGRLRVRCAEATAVVDPQYGFIVDPADSLWQRWERGTAVLTVQLDAAAVREHAEIHLGRRLDIAPRFKRRLDLVGGPGHAWYRQVWTIIRDLEDGNGWTRNPAMVDQLVHLLIDGLVLGQPWGHCHTLNAARVPIPPRAVRHLVDQIHARPEHAWTTADIARAAGAEVRTVQKMFAHYLNTTPQAYVRAARLACVHAALLAANPATDTVSRIARHWQFTELGRFAAYYRARYGEKPSDTLRR